MYHPFSIADTLKTSWKVYKKNFATLVVYSIISLIVYEAEDFFNNFLFVDDNWVARFSVIAIQLIVQAYIGLSYYKLILILMDREFYEFSFKDILPSLKMTFNFVLIAILYGVLIAALLFVDVVIERSFGAALIVEIVELVFIGYLLLRSIFCICFIVDDDSAPFESLRQSFAATKDNFFKTLSMFLIILAIMVAVLIPVVFIIRLLGLDEESSPIIFKLAYYLWFLVTFPFVQVIIMVTYRKLVYSHQDVDDDVSESV